MAFVSITFQGESGGKKFAFDPMAGRTGNKKVRLEKLDQMQKNAEDLSPAMAHALKLMRTNQMKLFDTEGGSVGRKWTPYTGEERRFYLPYKKAILGTERPMNRFSRSSSMSVGQYERLFPSMIMEQGSKGPEFVARSGKWGFEYGSRVPWAADIQRGGIGFRGKYQRPARTILKVSDDTMRQIVRSMQAHIMGGDMPEASL